MEISKDLKVLAEEFRKNGSQLYIVGGFVRDSLLGLEPHDIDIASSMAYEKVCQICKKLKYKCLPVNKKLGTLKILTKTEEYEYTQFRSESYTEGNHAPDKVIFVEDIMTDCIRRDITINSMYYSIIDNNIIDLVHGQKDLQNRIIRTSNNPAITLRDDGLRILRVIRFASIFDFKIEKNTYKHLKSFSYHLKDISKERIQKEIEMLTISDLKYGYSNTRFLDNLNKLKLYPIIFNHSLSRMKKLSRQDTQRFYKLKKDSRLLGFYFLILKNYIREYISINNLKFTCNLLFGREGIKESNDNIQTLEKLYFIYQNLENNIDSLNASINYLGLSNPARNIIDTFLNKKVQLILSDNISLIKSRNLPLGIHELDITGEDLLSENIESRFIGKILSTLFNQVIEMKVSNQKEELITLAKNINETFLHITKTEGEKNENHILPSRRKSSKSKKTKKSG